MSTLRTKIPVKIKYDWHQCGEGNGEAWSDYYLAERGQKDCVKIDYVEPDVDGEPHYADIHYADGRIIRTFNISSIEFHPISLVNNAN